MGSFTEDNLNALPTWEGIRLFLVVYLGDPQTWPVELPRAAKIPSPLALADVVGLHAGGWLQEMEAQ